MTTRLTARELALQSLLDRQGMVSLHMARLLADWRPSSPAEAALAMELTHGVMRRRRTLDAIARAYSDRPNKGMSPAIRQILRLAIYQIVFLDRIPGFAAVNEAVAACRSRQPRRAGFVNAVCRNIARCVGPAQAAPAPMTGHAVAISPEVHRSFDRRLFRPPEEGAARFLAELCSLPDDLARRWLARASSLEAAVAEALQSVARPPVVARVNAARAAVPDVLKALAATGVQAAAHVNGMSVVFVGHVNVAELAVFRDGLITPQDATATAVAPVLRVRPGMRVLDFCAAPGTKTTHLGELMGGQGEIVAVDVSDEKLAQIAEAARRCGLDLIRTCLAGGVASLTPGSFDRVLVDVPCSNTGVLARRVEARWRFRADRLGRLAADQRRLLAMAAMFVRPGGRLVYSTCSVEPEENQHAVRGFLRRHSHVKLVTERHVGPLGFAPPHRYHDGGYSAVLSVR